MVYLKYNNHRGAAIHATATANTRVYPAPSSVALRERRANGPLARKAASPLTKREPSVEADAEPLSSDEEEDDGTVHESLEPTPRSRRILQGFEKTDQEIRQRQDKTQQGKVQTGVKKGKNGWKKPQIIEDDPKELSLHLQDTSSKDENISEDEARMSSWVDPPKKKRKMMPFKTYRGTSSINIHSSTPSAASQSDFQNVPDLPSSDFVFPGEQSSSSTRQKSSSKFKDDYDSFIVPADIPDAASQILKLSGSTASSDSTLDSRNLLHSPSHRRTGSDSSLSSIQSISPSEFAEYEKDDQKKEVVPPSTVPCPLCGSSVPFVDLEEFTARHSLPNTVTRIPSRLQQIFCRTHQLRDAQEAYVERGYPVIDWEELATTRTTCHLPAMRAILNGRESSQYKDKLIEAGSSTGAKKGKAASGIKLNALLKYLKDGVLDVVKYGYYGPRGGKVAAETLMFQLSEDLAVAVEKDPLVRDATAVGFVQGVLVPELISRWVAEDLRAKHEKGLGRARGRRAGRAEDEDARVARVLEESSDIGRFLNEDEDQVIVDEDDL